MITDTPLVAETLRVPAILLATLYLPAPASGQSPRELSALVPAATPVVVDLHDAAATLRAALGMLEPLPRGLPELRLLLQALPLVTRAATGRDLWDLLEELAPGQVTLALYPGKPPFPVLLSRVGDPDSVRRLAARLGPKAPPHDLRGNVLTVTDTAAHLREVMGFRSSGAPTLLGDRGYRDHRAAPAPGRGVRIYVDLRAVRARTEGLFDRAPDPVRVLFGPILAAVDRATRLDGTVEFGAGGVRVRGVLDAGAGDAPADVLRARGGMSRAMPPEPAGTIALVSLDRDLAAALRRPEALLREDGQLGVKRFLSIADQLLGGKSFLEDLVPNIEVPLHLFVTEDTPDPDVQQPRVHLPAFALVFGVDGAAARRVQQILEGGMAMIAAVTNPGRIRAKRAALSVRGGRRDGYRYRFVEQGEFDGPGQPPTEHGLRPTLLFAHGHGVLASTVDGAVRVAKALADGERVEVAGDVAVVRGPALAGLIRANAGVLAMDRVLKEGGSAVAAQSFVRGLAAAAECLELSLRVGQGPSPTTELELDLRRLRR